MKNRNLRKGICLLLIFLGALQLLAGGIRYIKHERESKYLAGLFRQDEEQETEETTASEASDASGTSENSALSTDAELPSDTDASQETMSEQAEEPEMLSKFEKLYQENSDIIGWLSIDGMKIDYPVMQNEDDEFYLHRNFQKEDNDKYGCLYVRYSADVFTPGTNFIIYGHNMRDGSMFGDLDYYKQKSFYEEHPLINFDTLYEERTYEIVSVFLSQVYRDDEDVFKYYQFYQADTREEFQDFYDNIKALALYDTGVEAEYGDTFLTLSTCAYHVEDGRLVVVAKRQK